MSKNTTPTDTNRTDSNWAVEYNVEPIRIRDPIAEALAVLEPGEPFVVTYEDLVKLAEHSCPTASGAYRIAQQGLNTLYPDELPVRSDDATYGVMGRLISYVTAETCSRTTHLSPTAQHRRSDFAEQIRVRPSR